MFPEPFEACQEIGSGVSIRSMCVSQAPPPPPKKRDWGSNSIYTSLYKGHLEKWAQEGVKWQISPIPEKGGVQVYHVEKPVCVGGGGWQFP